MSPSSMSIKAMTLEPWVAASQMMMMMMMHHDRFSIKRQNDCAAVLSSSTVTYGSITVTGHPSALPL